MAITSNLQIFVQIDNERIELTDEALDVFLEQQSKDLAEKENIQAEAEAKGQAKAELLERLGITADEAKLLLA
jgi:hypothetical protein